MSLPEIITVGTGVITLGKSLWDQYSDQIPDWLKEKAKEKGIEYAKGWWEKFQFGRAEVEYKKKLFDDYGSIKLLGCSKPIPLEGIFTDVYILEELSSRQYFDTDNLEKSDLGLHINSRIKRLAGMDAVKQYHRLYILGKPGAGKTTFLRYIAMQAVKGKLQKTPIFVSLHEWANAGNIEHGHKVSLTLMDFIVKQFDIYNFPDAKKFIEFLLEKGDAIVLLDGLDEVSAMHDTYIKSEIDGFYRKYHKTQFLITCRIAAKKYTFELFTDMEVADFDKNQIETFVKKRLADSSLSDLFLTEFKKEEHRGLRDLASNPLLLGMLCLAFEKSKKFSVKRFDIYRRAFTALLKTWDEERFTTGRDIAYQELDEDCKIQLFETVGYETFNKKEYLIPQETLEKYITNFFIKNDEFKNKKIKGSIVLESIEANHGIFVERAQEVYSFAHLTFQEYFTACAISKNKNYQLELINNISDKRWNEVFLLTASSLNSNDSKEFFLIFKEAIDKSIKLNEVIINFLNIKKNDAKGSKEYNQDVYLFCICIDVIIGFTSFYINDYSGNGLDKNNSIIVNNLRDVNICNSNIFRTAIYNILHIIVAIDDWKGVSNIEYSDEYDENFRSLLRYSIDEARGYSLDNEFSNNQYKEACSIFSSIDKYLNNEISKNPFLELDCTLSFMSISEHDIIKLFNYLEINLLYRNCLKLATVSNRQELEDNLFFTAKPENKT